MPEKAVNQRRAVRSFVIRSGRLTESQQRAIDAHWDSHVVSCAADIDWSSQFPKTQPLTVEIGFGMGDSLLQMAAEQPDSNFVGIEVHRPGVGKLLNGISKLGLGNLKIVCHDAVEVLRHSFQPAAIDRILIFFPDPWHKKRHHKRRIVQSGFVSLLADRLRVGGRLHLATDWQPYSEHMIEILDAEASLENAFGEGAYWQNPERPATKFEQRGKRLGHGVWDLLYFRR